MIELAVGIGIARENGVAHRIALLIAIGRLEPGQQGLALLLAVERAVVGFAHGTFGATGFGRDAAIDVGEFRARGDERRVGRAKQRFHVGDIGGQLGAARAQALQRGAGHDRDIGIAPHLGLGGDAIGARAGEGDVGGFEIAGDQRPLGGGVGGAITHPIERDDALGLGVFDQLALRLFQVRAQLLKPLLKKRAGIGGGAEPAVHLGADELVDPFVGDPRGQPGVGAIELDIDQARSANRLDGNVVEQNRDRGIVRDLAAALPFDRSQVERLGKLQIGRKAQRPRHPFGDRAVVKQRVLSLVESQFLDHLVRLHLLDIGHLVLFARDFDPRRRGIARGHRQGDQEPQNDCRRHDPQDQIAAVDDRAPGPFEAGQRGSAKAQGFRFQHGLGGRQGVQFPDPVVFPDPEFCSSRISGVVNSGMAWRKLCNRRRWFDSPTTTTSPAKICGSG